MKISKIIVYIILIIYWGVFSYIYLHKLDPSPSILIQEHDASSLRNRELLTGEKISQEFISEYDNLGIIAIRFQTFGRINNDTLVFRLKDKNNANWYYTANYKTDQFQDHQFFPFGFPIIKNSKGNVYLVEIESKSGSEEGHIKVDRLLPTLISKHKYVLRQTFFSSDTFKYLLLKIQNMVSSMALLFPIIFYMLPLVQYVLHNLLIFSRKKVVFYTILLPFLFIVIYQPFSLSLPSFWEFTVIITWSIYLLLNKVTPKLNLVASMIPLIYIVFQLIEKNTSNAEMGSFWLFVLLLITMIHSMIVSLFKLKTIDIKTVFNNLSK